MYDSSLDIISDFKDLGLLVCYNLYWNSYINHIVSNAKRMLGLISRTCKGLFDLPTLKTLYCSLVRSQLEYSSVVWSSHTKRNIRELKQSRRRRQQERHKFAYLTMKNNSFARLKLHFSFLDILQTFSFFPRGEITCFAGRREHMMTNVQFCLLSEALVPIEF